MELSTHTLGIGFALIGATLAIVSAAWFWTVAQFQRTATRTTGEITGTIRDTTWKRDGGGTNYIPKFHFKTPDGQDWQVTSKIGASGDFAVGAQVTILYKPDHPAEAKIASFSQLWLGPIILSAVGIGVMSFGIFVLLRM